ncbi:aminoglycoside phosphotransferase family protein [Maritalea porphyrae]|uniref:Streptomycin 3''-phosphotransferase n=1 Tax=Maritalea porphyrae TaxID=880732 RepID=A0ABQ5ULY8_9HYPH|nr:aminoglycoside phosphotransferase family protein [Maritalea porphyrae]GLQ16288.1 streptomycin 3''-phosphotransferase [Maritalea porphyrae]
MQTKLSTHMSILDELNLSNATFVEETNIAQIWRVVQSNGEAAALKIYHNESMRDDAFGFAFLKLCDGQASAKVIYVAEKVGLTEWLEGPSLGNMVRAGQDKEASFKLVEVANKLHAVQINVPDRFPDLHSLFGTLHKLQFASDVPKREAQLLSCARELSKELLETQQNICALHGDLHHDNIRLGTRGYCAFDARGVVGEKTFELANAFRNPKGAQRIVFDPERIRYLAQIWSERFAVDRRRLLQWAAAKCALSIAWRSKGMFESDGEIELLALLLGAAEQA